MPSRRLEISVGDRFGRLTVQSDLGSHPKRGRMYRCACICGGTRTTDATTIKSGRAISCGCAQREAVAITGSAQRRHGRARHGAGIKGDRTYRSWTSMLSRCSNSNDPSFYSYGAMGISVTKPWRDSFEQFLSDMGERPPATSIDRIDNRWGYFAANCRWADKYQQARNRRKPTRVRFPSAMLSLASREMERTKCQL